MLTLNEQSPKWDLNWYITLVLCKTPTKRKGLVSITKLEVLQAIGLMSRVFANGPGDRGSIPGQVIPKTQKCYLMQPCLWLSIIRYGSRVKWSNAVNGVAPSSTPWCSIYRKGSHQVVLDEGRQLYYLVYSQFISY